MKRLLALGFLLAVSPLANAQDYDLARELGTVLAAEEPCGLSYDQAAIAAFIEDRVAADDMSFPSTLSSMTNLAEYSVEEMSQSATTAHCTQIARLAKTFGFVS